MGLPAPDHRSHDLLAVGANSLDILAVVRVFPEPDGKQAVDQIVESPGGEAATAAAAVARLGFRARYIGRFGADRFGEVGLAALAAAGVDIDAALTIPDAPTQSAVILVEAGSGRRSVLSRRAPGIEIEAGDIPKGVAAQARVLLVDGHSPAAASAAAAMARAAGTPVVADLDHTARNIEDLLALSDAVFVPEGMAEALTGRAGTGDALGALQAACHAPIVGATLGAGGVLTRAGGAEFRTPVFPVEAVDTTGAGDAFRGGFIGGWLALGRTAELEDVLRWGAAVAALACRGLGARTGLPTRAEVEALLAGG